MAIKDRIYEIMKVKNLKPASFERLCGLSNGYLRGIKGNIGVEKLEGILRAFPDISREWIVSGTGSMFVEGAVSNVNAQSVLNSTQVNSNNQNSNIVGDAQNEKLLELLSHSLQENTAQRQQMDRMITILERLTLKENDGNRETTE